MTEDVKKLSSDGLAEVLERLGQPRWRSEEIRRWIYGKGVTAFADMTSLPLSLREKLAREFRISTPAVAGRERDPDGTEKYLLIFDDDARCETVLIPQGAHHTQCLSSQSGCPLGCSFCHTGRLGLTRSLDASEIADQWLTVRRSSGEERKVSNLVFMGMGEPLLNIAAVRESIEILTAPWGGGLSPSRITVSTAGIIPGIEKMGREFPPVNLAVSLNAPEDSLRNLLMPVNRKYPLAPLMEALQRYPVSRRRITIEYVLLGGTNDSPAEARALAKLLRGIRCKINLIPFNLHSGLPYRPPTEESLARFQKILHRAGYTAPVRRSKGGSIAAACGQLGEAQR